MGRYIANELAPEGINCSHVVRDASQRTGFMFKESVAGGGDPVIEYHRKGSAASLIMPEDIDASWLTGARHLHATGVFAALSHNCLATSQRSMELMRKAGRTVSFDPNLRPSLWSSPSVMRETLNALALQADWVLPGIEEGRILTGAQNAPCIARFYLDRGAKLVVIKLGAEGAYYESDRARGHVEGFPVREVVDTVGAGDGFAAGAISALLDGKPVDEAVRRGAWIGARAVQVLGGTEGLPSRAELQEAGW